MTINRAKKIGLIALIMVSLTGCAIGNTVSVSKATLGQEYQDLKEALDEGAITQEEYENAKEKIKNGDLDNVRVEIDD